MTSLIPNEIIDSILDKIDIVEVISSHIPLKKIGRNFKAPCPFHNEKTPSFVVSPEKQIYHCFGCGQGGNAIGFLVKYDKLSFPEAVRMLAEKVGVKMPQSSFRETTEDSFIQRLIAINGTAENLYRSNLSSQGGALCRRYIKERGISDDTVKTFRLGYAPNGWEGLINFLKGKNIPLDAAHKAGLILPSEKDKGYYDRFRNRVIFPIFDVRDRVIAFGARTLGDSQPKYINSPETPLFTKGKHLYGLNFSKKYIRDKNYAIIVEGYLDLMMPFQHGVRNIVATLGTALTTQQVRLIKRFTKTVVMIFDPDKAGEDASLRGLDLLVSQDLNVRVATLPKGYDPDSFMRKEGREAFEVIVKTSKDLFDYKMDLLSKRYNKNGVRGKTAIATLMLPTIARIPNEILKAAFLKKLSDTLSIDEAAFKAELKKTKTDRYSYHEPQKKTVEKANPVRHAEMLLLSVVLEEPETLSDITEKLGQSEFKDENVRKVIELIDNSIKNNNKISPSKIINQFDDSVMHNLISEAVSIRETIANKEKTINDCINSIIKDNIRERLKSLQDGIRTAQQSNDSETVTQLVSEYNTLIKSHAKR
ncbi:MAG: DNA primase [Candidatus Omnitrophica bacterium]|nr:DNA primase [Candidatus Omnitrophota bacterium]